MRYHDLESLECFRDAVDAALFDASRRHTMAYPSKHCSTWNTDGLLKANEQLLAKIAGAANLYAIFTAPRDSRRYTLRYIGKTTRKLAKQRVTNHLIAKSAKTGAKLDEVMRHVRAGGTVQIAWVSIHTESLRNYLEEELIQSHSEADWNRENKKHYSSQATKPSASAAARRRANEA